MNSYKSIKNINGTRYLCNACGCAISDGDEYYVNEYTGIILCSKCKTVVRFSDSYDDTFTNEKGRTHFRPAKNNSRSKLYSSDLNEYRVKECSLCSNEKPVVVINYDVWAKIHDLMNECNHEWLAYLMGDTIDSKPKEYHITSIVVPRQEVSYSSCENKEVPPKDSIGIVHSHHTMFASHSSIDDNGIDQQNGVSIVVSTQGHSATVKVNLPCGRFMVVEAVVKVLYPKVDTSEFVREAKSKMSVITQASVQPYDWWRGGV